MEKKYDVFGLGNALMDVLAQVKHEDLDDIKIDKGTMKLVDEQEASLLQSKLPKDAVIVPGGSTANTISGIAVLGGSVIFCGKVGNDKFGELYEQKMTDTGVTSRIIKCEGTTGKAITYITPDSERTFATHLGVACDIIKSELIDEDIRDSKILHLTGYQLIDPALRVTSIHAMEIAKANRVLVSLDLADPNVVKSLKEELKEIIPKYVNVLFANEEEAKAFTGKDAHHAAEQLSKMVSIAVVKIGAKGSIITKGNETIHIKGVKAKAVDTTGAGDNYAAAFLYGMTHRFSLERAGKLASFVAAKAVEKVGARIDESIHEEIKKLNL